MIRYIGPDAVVPVASAVAAILGAVLMFWHATVRMLKGAIRWLGRLVGRRP